MRSFVRNLLFLILTMFILMPALEAKIVELDVYADWNGRDCSFKADKPFFLIRDIYDLDRFWKQANSDEPMPGIDFEKYMLLVWCPGASLFDYRPVRVDRFIYKEGNYFVLMEFERKDTGGFWRNPFMATLLPVARSGDICIMRKEVKGANKIAWKPMFTIWDMSGERNRPFELVKIDEITDTATSPALVMPSETFAAAEKQPAQISEPSQAQAASTDRHEVPATSIETGANIFADQVSGSDSSDDRASTKTKSVAPASVPAIEEDPLFGSEFDINF